MIPLTTHFDSDRVPSIDVLGWNMAGGYYLPKGRSVYRVWYPWKGKVIYVNKYLDGTPIYSEGQATRVLEKIRGEVDGRSFDPALWGKDRSLIFQRAWRIYQEQSPCGKDRATARERICENFLLPYFKNKSLVEIDEHHIRDWWSRIPKTYAPSTLRVIRATLRAFLNFNKVTRAKMLSFPMVKVPRKTPEWLTKEEQEKVMRHIPIQHKPIFQFLRLYGCRVSEAVNLKKSDIDWGKEIVIFRERKNFCDNVLPLFDQIKPLVKPGKITNLEYVFCSINGDKYSRQGLYHTWIEATQKAGIKTLPLKNATRHSLACQLLNAGEPSSVVARILGITSSVVERYYGAISLQTATEVLSRVRKMCDMMGNE